MPTCTAIAQFTGFDRHSIKTRQTRWGLGKEIDPKAVLQLRPLDEQHAQRISLEAARTDLAIEETRLKRLQAEKIEGEVAEVSALMKAENDLLEGIAQIIKGSDLNERAKDDIFNAIRDHGKKWAEGFDE